MPAGKAWSRPDDATLKRKLSPLQYQVTRKDGTEPPFNNEYHDNKREGIYVDIVSGEPLFSSLDKYDSGTGWPSFTKPLEPGNVVERKDRHLFMVRTEVRSRNGGLPPRTRLPRRPCADGATLLHELGGPALHPEGGSGKGRLRGISEAIREGVTRFGENGEDEKI